MCAGTRDAGSPVQLSSTGRHSQTSPTRIPPTASHCHLGKVHYTKLGWKITLETLLAQSEQNNSTSFQEKWHSCTRTKRWSNGSRWTNHCVRRDAGEHEPRPGGNATTWASGLPTTAVCHGVWEQEQTRHWLVCLKKKKKKTYFTHVWVNYVLQHRPLPGKMPR